jgi:hypothetical protein
VSGRIDRRTKDLVKQLRENNVNLGKVYSIVGSFFRKMGNVPFTKRALKTLCGKISSEQADDNVRKTIEVFWAAGPEFTYIVQVDDDSESVNHMLKTYVSPGLVMHVLNNLTNCYMMGTRKRASRRRGHGW